MTETLGFFGLGVLPTFLVSEEIAAAVVVEEEEEEEEDEPISLFP